MADPASNPLTIDPPIKRPLVTPRHGRTSPVIATGHQPYLWHAGILAKDIAADALAMLLGGTALHVVVEHNPIDSLALDVPRQLGQALSVHRCQLAPARQDDSLPPNVATPVDAGFAISRLENEAATAAEASASHIPAGLSNLAQAFDRVGDTQPDRAQQLSAVMDQLKRPYLHRPMQSLLTRDLVTPGFVSRVLADPVGCARYYNRAAAAYPEAGIRQLYVGRDVVEVPLWAQRGGGCMPVYADLGDSAKPLLFTSDRGLDLAGHDALTYLRPRAISLSAIMRSELCDLFIHGRGGGVYDQVTERWWRDWVGEPLAPMMVVSADVYMPFDVPTATQSQHIQAQWYAHHLPHNVDRYVEASDDAEAALRAEKHALLDHMNDDRDKRRRAKAFRRIHAINASLCEMHRSLLRQADEQAEAAQLGLSNALVLSRRDWCFALLPAERVMGLAQQIRLRLDASL